MAGDVYLVVHIEPHKFFERKGADLFIKKKISLIEALTGFEFQIDHLDNTKFVVKNSPGEIISSG
jgi:DnaJ family protein A protein 2